MSEKGSSTPSNPLRSFWNLLGTIGGVISLASMVQDWFQEALKWKGFVGSIIESYRSITRPIWEAIFGWLPWDLFWIGDYLVIGFLVYVSNYKAISIERASGLTPPESNPLGYAICITLFWPVVVCAIIFVAVFPFQREIEEPKDNLRNSAIAILLWYGAILLGLVTLLAINAQL